MRRPWPGVVGAVIVCGAAWGQEHPADPYAAILDEARAAPVEIFADVTFRLLYKLAPKAKAAALEEVFRRAGEAREALPLQYGFILRPTGRAEVLDHAHDLGLDALSLRCRAVRECLASDPRLARRLFDDLPHPEVPRTECESGFVPDSGVYVRTLAAVAERGAFTPEERAKQAPWGLVERGAHAVGGSWEIIAAASELPRFATNRKEAAILSAALAGALSISDSDRAYTSAVRHGGLVKAVLAAAEKLSPDGGANMAMLWALRGYLVRHLSASRCGDLAPTPPGGWTRQRLDTIAQVFALLDGFQAFNEAVAKGTDIPAITVDESSPKELKGKAALPGDDPREFQALSAQVEELGKTNKDESLWKTRLTAGWAFRARQALSGIEDWKPAPGQDPLEVFHQKCRLLARIADMAPTGETQRIATSEMISLMEDPALLARSPAEWLLEVRWLLAMQSIFTPERVQAIKGLLGPGAAADSFVHQTGFEIPQALAASRLPALSLYGRLALAGVR